ncbi:MAG: class I SAM-dependent methyltransferase [Proteobacteria bacterium]|nr:class I SAM-dependent methyltransferase [Pseudomonadota bacterium]
MSRLLIVSASFQQFGAAALDTFLTNTLPAVFAGGSARALDGSVALHPSSVAIDRTLFAETIPYGKAIGLEQAQEIWRPLRARRFEEIVVLGIEPIGDYEEIVLACYLEADKKGFLGRHGFQDLAGWQEQVKPNLAPREVRLRDLGPEKREDYIQGIHRWLVTEMTSAGFAEPRPAAPRSPEVSIYWFPRLALDLAQQTYDLQVERHGVSFSTLLYRGGPLVHTSDFYRVLANFVMAIDGIDTVLDVGCGSGLLACHLAASGRYKAVLGIDSSRDRVSGARLFAELNGSSARFDANSMTDIRLPDQAVDLSVTSFALEQTGEHLARCFSEIRRVTRKMIVLFEPTTEFFPTLGSLWHLPYWGWANRYQEVLTASGLAFATRPIVIYHYFNPGTAFVVDLQSREHPCLTHPHLFGQAPDDWPGGLKILQGAAP